MLYFTIFLLIFIAGFLDLSDSPDIIRKVVFWLFIVILITLSAIRWKTGTDWPSYIYFFNNSNTFSQFTDGRFEFGYGLLNFIAKSISSNYSVFLGLFTLVTVLIKAQALSHWRYNQYFLISFLIYYSYYIGDMFPIRQSLALSVILFSGQYLIDRKLISFLICVYIATLFHTSSFIFFAAYPLSFIKLKTKVAVILLILSAIGGYVLTSLNAFSWLTKIPWLADEAQYKLEAYSAMASNGIDTTGGSDFVDPKTSFITGLIRKVVVLVPLILFRKKLAEKFDYFNILFNLIIFGAIFYFTLGTLIQVLKRGASYFDFFEVLVLPMLIYISNNKWQRIFIYCMIAVYSFAKLFMVLRYYWDAYVPYNTIFDNVQRNW